MKKITRIFLKYANSNWSIKNIGHFWRDFPFKKHPFEDVKPVKFVVQYLTQATVKLPNAGDDMHSNVQHIL